MNRRLYFLFAMWVLFFGTTTANADEYRKTQSIDPFCDCKTALNPTFELSLYDASSCSATFTVDPGDKCLDRFKLKYYWVINNEGVQPTLTSLSDATFFFEEIGSIEHVELKVVAYDLPTGDFLCSKTTSSAFSDVTCDNTANPIIEIFKEAYSGPTSNVPLNMIYVGQPFEWRVIIFNDTPNLPVVVRDVFPNADIYDADPTDGFPDNCGFNLGAVTATDGAGNPIALNFSPVNQDLNIILPAGITVVRYATTASTSDCVGAFENCFELTPPNATEPIRACDTVNLIYGCPAVLTDAYCLEEQNSNAGDILRSDAVFHSAFAQVTGMQGKLIYDDNMIGVPTIELDPLLADFDVEVTPIEPGAVSFNISTDDAMAAFDISGSGTWKPFKVKGELLQDLDICFSIIPTDFVITTIAGGNSPLFLDPGIFCGDYGASDYDSAWIITEDGATCVGESLELTASGPFESQDVDVQYNWSNGSQERVTNIFTAGTYTVDIIDENGCERSASVTVGACDTVNCECDDLNPQIQLSIIDGCAVKADINMNSCENIEVIQYYWTFSNGMTYEGQFPPLQTQNPLGGNFGAKVLVKYILEGGEECAEYDKTEVFVPCRNPQKDVIKISPNPANDRVDITILDDVVKSGTIELSNTIGTILLKESYKKLKDNTVFNFNVSRLKSGIYFVKFTDSSGYIEIKRLIIK